MKKQILLTCLLLFFTAGVQSQQFTASYSTGYGEYKMQEMQQALERVLWEISSQIPDIPFAIVDNFPGYVTHSLDLGCSFHQHVFGVKGMYLTTGGKVAYADYTGEYMGKLTLNGYRIGVFYRYSLPVAQSEKAGQLSLFGELSPAITFSRLNSREHLRLFDQTEKNPDHLAMNGNGFSILPQVGIQWSILPFLGIYVSGGYDFQVGSQLKMKGENTNLKADWTGLRINGGLSITID